MNHFYFLAGLVERPQGGSRRRPCSYGWRQGYSRIMDGHATLPWSTRAEASFGARQEGVVARFFREEAQAVEAERAQRVSGIYLRYDVWCLRYWSPEANDYTCDHFAYDLQTCIQQAGRISFGLNNPQPIRLVHPAEWVLRAWVAHNGAPLGKQQPRVCECAVTHGPTRAMKRPEGYRDCRGHYSVYDFYKLIHTKVTLHDLYQRSA
jgi:hypothetical protein